MARNASSGAVPAATFRDTSAGITLASVVISRSKLNPSSSMRSAKLSTSPFSTPTTYGTASRPGSSWFSGCAFASLMLPTLAQRV